jgi:hypothetical protein
MTPADPRRSIATTCLAITLAFALTACGAPDPSPSAAVSASPAVASSPAVSPSTGAAAIASPPHPSPSQAPTADVAKRFLAILTGPTFTANATITGEVTIGSARFAVSGTSAIRGADNRQAITIAIPGAPQTTESLTTDGVSYAKRQGHWFVKPAAPTGSTTGPDLASAMRSVLDVVDTGVESKGGRALHHLKPRNAASIPISAIRATDPTGDGALAFDFYVEDDGTPVLMDIQAAWTQTNGTAREPVSMTIEYAFSNVGGRVVIDPPDQVWQTFTSKRFGYSMAYPSDWETHQSGGKTKPDSILSADEAGLAVYRYPREGSSLNAATSRYVNTLKRLSKATVTKNEPVRIAGLRARRLEWSATFQGTRAWIIEVVLVRGKFIYFFEYTGLEKTGASDRRIFSDLVSSVTFPS